MEGKSKTLILMLYKGREVGGIVLWQTCCYIEKIEVFNGLIDHVFVTIPKIYFT